jgi:hypothetical protein
MFSVIIGFALILFGLQAFLRKRGSSLDTNQRNSLG